jgi:hypothetical protein
MDTPNQNTIARWWNTFNSWRWPDDYPNKPAGFDDLPNRRTISDPLRGILPDKFTFITPINRQLRATIGRKKCLRYHHIHNLNRTDEQFEEWWKEGV